jgi:hypothetical protein
VVVSGVIELDMIGRVRAWMSVVQQCRRGIKTRDVGRIDEKRKERIRKDKTEKETEL